MMYLISEERLKEIADIMRNKTGETEECSLEEIKNKLEAVRTENDFLKFYGCEDLFNKLKSSLTEIPKIDTRSVTNMNRMFRGCSSLTTVPQIDTSSVTNTSSMFYGCSSLTTVPQLDTSSVTDASGVVCDSSSLPTIRQLDTRSVTDASSMFPN